MDFEWDPDKREANLKKHGVDFLLATQVLLGVHCAIPSPRTHEKRWAAVGPLPEGNIPSAWSGPLCTVVYTRRKDTYRIISARRARKNERRAYREKIAGGD